MEEKEGKGGRERERDGGMGWRGRRGRVRGMDRGTGGQRRKKMRDRAGIGGIGQGKEERRTG